MKKVYIVRHFIEASSIREAIKLTQNRQPDDVYISDDWLTKVGFVNQTSVEVRGFKK